MSLKMKSWLEAQGIKVHLPSKSLQGLEDDPCIPLSDLIIILGGDGTILSQARLLLDQNIPFLGVNLGVVGFMADISPHSWREQLSGLLATPVQVSKRCVLAYEVVRDKSIIHSGTAINEVVINRGRLARLVCINLTLPGGAEQHIRADGLIVATPTGSTAYSVSAGGPLVHPEMEAVIITPICPFLHDFKPLILPSDSRLYAGIHGDHPDVHMTIDGQTGFRIKPGDRVAIFRHFRDFKLLRCPEHSYIAKLVAKRFLKRR